MEIDVREEIETFRFADGAPGENTVYLQDDYGIVVVNGENKGESEVNIGDIDNLIEALKQAKESSSGRYMRAVSVSGNTSGYTKIPPVKFRCGTDYAGGTDYSPIANFIRQGGFDDGLDKFFGIKPELDWIRHDGGDCPVHPLDIVETVFHDGSGSIQTADFWVWGDGLGPEIYKIIKDEDGVPYVSNEVLEPWAEYVASDEDGEAWQFENRPMVEEDIGEWYADCSMSRAPHHDNTFQHWTETLRRVWRK